MSLYLGNQKVTPTVVYKDNKIAQLVDGTITEITAEDLKGITSIRDYAFYHCSKLTSITIPDSVTSIGNYALYECSGLTSVTYLGTIDQWVEISFSNDSSNPMYNAHNLYINDELVTEVNLTTATKISPYAFRRYRGLTSITISDSVKRIGYYAFSGCSGLTSVTMLSTTPPTIESLTFPFGFSGTITVPAGTGATYKAATNWSKYADKIQEAAA